MIYILLILLCIPLVYAVVLGQDDAVPVIDFTLGRTDYAYLGADNIFTGNNSFFGTTWFFNVIYVNRTNIEVNGSVNATEYCIGDVCVTDLSDIINVPDTNASTECDAGEYLDGDSSCYNFNNTVNNLTATTVYLPSIITTEVGTVDAGNLASIQGFNDGDSYNISEVAGAPGIQVFINFTDVEDFNEGIIREQYVGGSGHTIHIGVWNYVTEVWDEEWSEITDQADFVIITGSVFGASNYIGTGAYDGIVQIRLNHDDAGNQNHDFYIEYIALRDGFTSLVTTDHDALSNRDNVENHPWAMDTAATRNFTANTTIEPGSSLLTDGINSVSAAGINIYDQLVMRLGEIIDNIYDGYIRITAHLNVTGAGFFEENVTLGSGDSERGLGVDFGGVYYLNDDGQRVYNRTDNGSVTVNGTMCDMNGCINGSWDQSHADTLYQPINLDVDYIHWAENQDLTDATAEWSIANGEVGVFVPVFNDSTITNVGLWCNTVIGAVNITVQKYGSPVEDIGCNLVGTAPYIMNCSVDVDGGDWLRPYTVTDTGHVSCTLTWGLVPR